MKNTITLSFVIIVTLMISGCGRGYERCSVEGVVIFDGKPLDGAYVALRPSAGPGGGADTQADGTFVIPMEYGPMPGPCEFFVTKSAKVSVRDGSGRSADEERSVIPEKFAQKPKVIELKSGKNTVELNLDLWE